MARKGLEECKEQRDFLSWARRRGATVASGGRHMLIRYDGYSVPVPNGEIRPGTKRAIVKALLKIGLAVLFLAGSFAAGGLLALAL